MTFPMAMVCLDILRIQVDLRDLWGTLKSVGRELGGGKDTGMDKCAE